MCVQIYSVLHLNLLLSPGRGKISSLTSVSSFSLSHRVRESSLLYSTKHRQALSILWSCLAHGPACCPTDREYVLLEGYTLPSILPPTRGIVLIRAPPLTSYPWKSPAILGTNGMLSGEQLPLLSSSPWEGGGFMCIPDVLTSAFLHEATDFH